MENKTDYNTQKNNESFNRFNQEVTKIKDKYMVLKVLTKHESESYNNPRFKEGDSIPCNPPIPNDPKQAFEQFANYYAAIQCELQKMDFELTYKVWNEATIKMELNNIEEWIKEAGQKGSQVAYSNAIKNNQSLHNLSLSYKFIQFRDGYYEDYVMSYEELNENSCAACVYGRYFLFYEFLKVELKGFQQECNNDKVPIDPLTLIETGILQLFLDVEKKALGETGEFSSNIRCAAFCEMLYYDKPYIIKTKTPQKTMNNFAISRYKLDISKALLSSKKKERNDYKNNRKGGLPSLKSLF